MSKRNILTSDGYFASLQQLVAKKDAIVAAKEQRKIETKELKQKRDLEKAQKEVKGRK